MADPDLTMVLRILQDMQAWQRETSNRLDRIEHRLDSLYDDMKVTTGMAMHAMGSKDVLTGLLHRIEKLEKRMDQQEQGSAG